MSEFDFFLSDTLEGLSQDPKTVPCKYLYDERGSTLFEAICNTQDYYVTRADLALHDEHLPQISALIGRAAHVIEFGSGAGIKTQKLLAALDQPRAYTPIEISESALSESSAQLQKQFPELEVRPVCADYTQPIEDAELALNPPADRRVIYFPGSTISNFERDDAIEFLARMGRIIGQHGGILIGVDLLKPAARLVQAYDDDEGVTADFNLNLLDRMRRELDAEIERDDFAHEARFNAELGRIEMHLVAVRATEIKLNGHCFKFEIGQSIHTENSHKYSISGFKQLAEAAGLRSTQVWTDSDQLFSMHWLVNPE